jgi:pilus assembly protein CpaC
MKIMGDRIVIDGEVVVLNDLNRLYTVVSDSTYANQVLLLVGVSPVGMQIMAERIQAEINKPNVKVRPFNGLFLVEGQVDNAEEGRAVLDIARSMLAGFAVPKISPGAVDLKGPIDVKAAVPKDPIVARLTIAPPKPKAADKMIRVTIDFVELSKDYLRNFGFQWIPTLDGGGSVSFGESTTGGLTSSSGGSSLTGTIAKLFPRLQTAQNAGYARILEESVLLVKSGGKANFNRKLEVPIQTINAQGQPVFSKQEVGPEIDMKNVRIVGQSEDVELDIGFNYKGLAGKTASALILLGHKYDTNIIVKSGESAALVNAMSNVISTAFNKDPVSQVQGSPLFTLLRSKAFQKNKSQFVVFLTPQIINSASEGTEDIKNKYGLKRKQQ